MSYKLLKVPPLEGFHPAPETAKTELYLPLSSSSSPVIVSTASSAIVKTEVVSSTVNSYQDGDNRDVLRPTDVLRPSETFRVPETPAPRSYRLLPEVLMPPPPAPRSLLPPRSRSRST